MRKTYPKYKSTGFAWLTEIPEHWNLIRAKHIFKVIDDKTANGNEELLSVSEHHGVIPRKYANVNTFKAESYEGYKLCKKKDLVINSLWAWSCGLGVSEYEGIVSNAYSVYRLKIDAHHRYFNYLLRTKGYVGQYFIRSKGIWISRLQLSDLQFLDIPIVLPPLEEQTAIANYLDAKTEQINRFIAKKEKLIALLKEQKQAVINELLEDKEGKWERRKLKYIASMKSGNFIDASDIYETGDFPVFGGNGLRGFTNNYTHDGEYVLIGRQGALCGNVNFASGKFWPSEHAIVCTPKIKFDTFWFGHAVRSLNLGQYSQSAAQPGISIGVVSNVSLSYPDYNNQLKISEQIKSEEDRIDETIIRIEKEIEKVKELKQSLIAEVVTGKIKIL